MHIVSPLEWPRGGSGATVSTFRSGLLNSVDPTQQFLAGTVYTAVEIQKAMMNNSLSAAQS